MDSPSCVIGCAALCVRDCSGTRRVVPVSVRVDQSGQYLLYVDGTVIQGCRDGTVLVFSDRGVGRYAWSPG